MSAPRRGPVIAGFVAVGALEIGLVWAVVSDAEVRLLFTGLLAVAQVVGCVAFLRVLARPRRRP